MCDTTTMDAPALSRRRMLGMAALSGAAALGGTALLPRPAHALPWERGPIDTPDQALAALMEGNRRFVSGHVTAPHRNLERVREVAPRQTPFAAILGCADSRVPVEILFDQGFGDLFVCRAAGNVATPEITGSLEYGAKVLGAKVVMVLGHSACGAVKATLEGHAVPGQISALFQHILPATARSGGSLDRAIEENVKDQAALLSGASTVLAEMVRAGEVKVVGAVYDLNTGAVRMV